MNVDRDKVLKTKDKGKTVSLMYEKGKNRSYSITRLMYSAFVGEIPDGYYVVCDGAVTVDNLRLEHQNERKRLAGMASARQRRGNFIPGESPNEMIASWLKMQWVEAA
jgi:hypothetical protein